MDTTAHTNEQAVPTIAALLDQVGELRQTLAELRARIGDDAVAHEPELGARAGSSAPREHGGRGMRRPKARFRGE